MPSKSSNKRRKDRRVVREEEEPSNTSDFEFDLDQQLEDLGNRRPSVPHLMNLQRLYVVLSRNLSSEKLNVLSSFSSTAHDALLTHSLKSKSNDTKCTAVKCMGMLFIQLSNCDGDYSDDFSRTFDAIVDTALSSDVDVRLRSEILRMLVVGDLMLNEDFELRRRLLTALLNVLFNVKVTSGNGQANRNGECSVAAEILCASVLEGYGCAIPSSVNEDMSFALQSISSFFSRCPVLLRSSSVSVRTAVCNVLAIIAEQSRTRQIRSIRVPPHICEQVEELATEVSKRVHKKGLNAQRNGFKRLDTYLKDGEHSNQQKIKLTSSRSRIVDGSDCLIIDTFHKEICYEILSQVLGSDFIEHLKRNEAVRAMFGLYSAPIMTDDSDNDDDDLTGSGNSSTIRKDVIQRFHKANAAERNQKIGRERDQKHNVDFTMADNES